MAGRQVVPVRSLSMRLPDAGRIRIGVKGAKGQPQRLDRFRFTSQDQAALDQVAALYGGTVKPWSDPKAAAGQFEVITDAPEIRIALPPDPLGNTPIYEMWSGGGCQRRCDGETCEMLTQGSDGLDLTEVPCLCEAKGELACKLTTRLSVLLPEIRFVGVWRIDTHSWNAAQELPGMVQLIRSLQDRGIVRGLLRVEQRVQMVAGETRRFAVPVLGVDETVEALAAGAARMGALASSVEPPPALGAGSSSGDEVGSPQPSAELHPPVPHASSPDDEIVDAELVDDRSLADVLPDSVPQGKALALARKLAPEFGAPLPTSLEAVTDYQLIAKVLVELGCVEAIG